MAPKDRWLIYGPIAILLLAGCERREAPSAQPAQAESNDYKARVEALQPASRNALFLRAIRDAGRQCQSVAGSAYNGEQFGMPSWVARCEDGRDWLVMLRQDGSALVALREEAAAK